MWFKLASANFSNNSLGKMSTLSTTWSITKRLSGFTETTNTGTSVEKGAAYYATFTLNSGETYKSHSVTMNGSAVTSGVSYSNGTLTVNISAVTGPVVITAFATGSSSDEGEETYVSYTGESVFSVAKYALISSSGTVTEGTHKSMYATDYLPVTSENSVWLKYIFVVNDNYPCIGLYDSNKALVHGINYDELGLSIDTINKFSTPAEPVKISDITTEDVAYVRFITMSSIVGIVDGVTSYGDNEGRIYN